MELNNEQRRKVQELWQTDPYRIFTWETVKTVANNPLIKDVRDLKIILNKIIRNRMNK